MDRAGAGAAADRHRHTSPTYFSGAQFVHFLLGPAVVAQARPLWQRRAELRRRWLHLLASLAPKSLTGPVATGIAAQLGGILALAAVFAVLTGLVGAVSGKYQLDALRVGVPGASAALRSARCRTKSAPRALQVHPDAGAYAALALGMQVLLAALTMPLVMYALRLF